MVETDKISGLYEVVSPGGESAAETIAASPELDTLDGKTICEIWNHAFRGDESFPIINEMLRERYPNIKVIEYTEFPAITVPSFHPANKAKTVEAVREAIKEKGCDAVITGNGG